MDFDGMTFNRVTDHPECWVSDHLCRGTTALEDAMLSEIERLRAELAECKQEWQTMETAPKDGSRILLATPSGKIADGFWSLEYRVWSWPYVMVEPTHWTRSLPIPGRKGEGE